MESVDWDRIAPHYFEEISSPFVEGVQNPLFEALEKVAESRKKNIIDLGCGIGNLEPFLSQNFKQVTAVDFSKKMIEIAGEKCKELGNVVLFLQDMRNMARFHDKFQLAVAVNSIVTPSLVDIDKIFGELAAVLKSKGLFLGIFPSMDSEIYRAMLTYEREYQKTHDEHKAISRTRMIMHIRKYDFALGFYENQGKQKHFYNFELEHRFRMHGFQDIRIQKVYYPWSMCEDEEAREFEGMPKLYDWFVSATKE